MSAKTYAENMEAGAAAWKKVPQLSGGGAEALLQKQAEKKALIALDVSIKYYKAAAEVAQNDEDKAKALDSKCNATIYRGTLTSRMADFAATRQAFGTALEDAETLIRLRPDWCMGYMRKLMSVVHNGGASLEAAEAVLAKALELGARQENPAIVIYVNMLHQLKTAWKDSEARFQFIVKEATKFVQRGKATVRILDDAKFEGGPTQLEGGAATTANFKAKLLIDNDQQVDADVLTEGTWALALMSMQGIKWDEIVNGDKDSKFSRDWTIPADAIPTNTDQSIAKAFALKVADSHCHDTIVIPPSIFDTVDGFMRLSAALDSHFQIVNALTSGYNIDVGNYHRYGDIPDSQSANMMYRGTTKGPGSYFALKLYEDIKNGTAKPLGSYEFMGQGMTPEKCQNLMDPEEMQKLFETLMVSMGHGEAAKGNAKNSKKTEKR